MNFKLVKPNMYLMMQMFPGLVSNLDRDSRLRSLLGEFDVERLDLVDVCKPREFAIPAVEAVFRANQDISVIALGVTFLVYIIQEPEGRALHEYLIREQDLGQFDLVGTVIRMTDFKDHVIRVNPPGLGPPYELIPFVSKTRRPVLVYRVK